MPGRVNWHESVGVAAVNEISRARVGTGRSLP